jgi:hypothetical protein
MRNLNNTTLTELTEDFAVQMIDVETGEHRGQAPANLFGAVEQYPSVSDFPEEGKTNALYIDTSTVPYRAYAWSGTQYIELAAPITMAGSILAAMACVGSPIFVPSGNPLDVQTVGTGGDHADLSAALASGNVVDGTILEVVSDQVLTTTLNVNKAVVINLGGFKLDSGTAGPVVMVNMTAPLSVVKNGTVNHLKTTNTSVETVFNLASTDPTKPVFVVGNTINVMEFGVTARGNYVLDENSYAYIGASQTNSHRFITLYGNSGESKITGNTFTAVTSAGTRYTNFILMTSTAGTSYSGKLYVDQNVQTGGSLRQFLLHEAGVPTGMELYVSNNEFDDLNGGIGIFSPALYNGYAKIGIFNNTQGGSAVGNYKGVFFVDGTGALNDTVELTYGGNTTAAGPLRADYTSLDSASNNIIAVKNTVTFTAQKTPTVVDEESLSGLGNLLQDLKGQRTHVVGASGTGTQDDPYVIPEAEPTAGTTPAYAADIAAAPDGSSEGQLLYITNTGDQYGVIEEVYAWIGGAWSQHPLGAATTEPAPALPVAVSIGTQAQLDALTDKVAGGFYIVTDGAGKGDILRWTDSDDDGAGDTWATHLVPTNGLEWNVLTNATGEPAGTYSYSLATDSWSKTAELTPLVPSVDDPVAVGGIKMIGRYMAPRSGNGGVYILGDAVAGHGRSISFATDNGSVETPTAGDGFVRKAPFTYYQTDTPYAAIAVRDAWAVDVQFNQAGAVAMDDAGILYYKGTAAFMTAMTGADTAISTKFTSGYIPDKFWADRPVKVIKFWLSYATNNLMALAGDGTIWVRGNAGASGIYGDGTVVADKLWHKVNVPQQAYKKIYIIADGTACGALSAAGVFYVWGLNTSYRIVGAGNPTGAIPTPSTPAGLSASNVKDFAMDASSTMVVANNGRYAIGINNNGKFGNTNTTNLQYWTLLPSSGFTYDKVFSMDGMTGDAYYYITADKRAVMSGRSNMQFASSAAAGDVTTPTLMGSGLYQGFVMDIRAYDNSCLIHTDQGTVWTASNTQGEGELGWGAYSVLAVGLNIFKRVPVPGLVVGVQSSQDSGVVQTQYTVLTNRGQVYSWGALNLQLTYEQKFVPCEIPTQKYRQLTPKANSQIDLLSRVATLTTISSGTAGNIVDGNSGQTVTFSLPYSGTAGRLSTTGWTITGADVTVSNIQNPVLVQVNSGVLTFTATVNASDIAGLVPPNTQPQSYTLTAGSLTASVNGTRITDAIAGSLTASLSNYNSAPAGSYIWITAAEWTALQTSVASVTAGVNDAAMTAAAFNLGSSGPFSVSTGVTGTYTGTSLPAGVYPFAIKVRTAFSSTLAANLINFGYAAENQNSPASYVAASPVGPSQALVSGQTYYALVKGANLQTPAVSAAVVDQVGVWLIGVVNSQTNTWNKILANQNANVIFMFQMLASPKKW